jgi:hypothetical protein
MFAVWSEPAGIVSIRGIQFINGHAERHVKDSGVTVLAGETEKVARWKER